MVDLRHSAHHHGTAAEMHFIDGLGSYRDSDRRGKDTREQLLSRYLSSISKRTHWGTINRNEVEAYVRRLLGGV